MTDDRDIFGIGTVNELIDAPEFQNAEPERRVAVLEHWAENTRSKLNRYGKDEEKQALLPAIDARLERERAKALDQDEIGRETNSKWMQLENEYRSSLPPDPEDPAIPHMRAKLQESQSRLLGESLVKRQKKQFEDKEAARQQAVSTYDTLTKNLTNNGIMLPFTGFKDVTLGSVKEMAQLTFASVAGGVAKLATGSSETYSKMLPKQDAERANKVIKDYYETKNPESRALIEKYAGVNPDEPGLADTYAVDFSRNERQVSKLSDGSVIVNPALLFDKKGWDAAVDSTDATDEAKQTAKKSRIALRDDATPLAQVKLSELSSYREFAYDYRKANPGAPGGEVVEKYMAQGGGTGWEKFKEEWYAGLAGISTQIYGFYGMTGLPGSEGARSTMRDASEMQQASAGIVQQAGGLSWSANPFTKSALVLSADVPFSIAPSIATGGAARFFGAGTKTALNIVALSAAAQSAGGSFSDYYNTFREKGMSDAEATSKARVPALLTGAVTGVLTRVMPEGTESAIVGGVGRELEKKSLIKAFLTGGKEEVLEEELDQFGNSIISAAMVDPTKSLSELWDELAATAGISILSGGLMSAASQFDANRKIAPKLAELGHLKRIVELAKKQGMPQSQAAADALMKEKMAELGESLRSTTANVEKEDLSDAVIYMEFNEDDKGERSAHLTINGTPTKADLEKAFAALEETKGLDYVEKAIVRNELTKRYLKLEEDTELPPPLPSEKKAEPIVIEIPNPKKRAAAVEPAVVEPAILIEPTLKRQVIAQKILAEQERVAKLTQQQRDALEMVSRGKKVPQRTIEFVDSLPSGIEPVVSNVRPADAPTFPVNIDRDAKPTTTAAEPEPAAAVQPAPVVEQPVAAAPAATTETAEEPAPALQPGTKVVHTIPAFAKNYGEMTVADDQSKPPFPGAVAVVYGEGKETWIGKGVLAPAVEPKEVAGKKGAREADAQLNTPKEDASEEIRVNNMKLGLANELAADVFQGKRSEEDARAMAKMAEVEGLFDGMLKVKNGAAATPAPAPAPAAPAPVVDQVFAPGAKVQHVVPALRTQLGELTVAANQDNAPSNIKDAVKLTKSDGSELWLGKAALEAAPEPKVQPKPVVKAAPAPAPAPVAEKPAPAPVAEKPAPKKPVNKPAGPVPDIISALITKTVAGLKAAVGIANAAFKKAGNPKHTPEGIHAIEDKIGEEFPAFVRSEMNKNSGYGALFQDAIQSVVLEALQNIYATGDPKKQLTKDGEEKPWNYGVALQTFFRPIQRRLEEEGKYAPVELGSTPVAEGQESIAASMEQGTTDISGTENEVAATEATEPPPPNKASQRVFAELPEVVQIIADRMVLQFGAEGVNPDGTIKGKKKLSKADAAQIVARILNERILGPLIENLDKVNKKLGYPPGDYPLAPTTKRTNATINDFVGGTSSKNNYTGRPATKFVRDQFRAEFAERRAKHQADIESERASRNEQRRARARALSEGSGPGGPSVASVSGPNAPADTGGTPSSAAPDGDTAATGVAAAAAAEPVAAAEPTVTSQAVIDKVAEVNSHKKISDRRAAWRYHIGQKSSLSEKDRAAANELDQKFEFDYKTGFATPRGDNPELAAAVDEATELTALRTKVEDDIENFRLNLTSKQTIVRYIERLNKNGMLRNGDLIVAEAKRIAKDKDMEGGDVLDALSSENDLQLPPKPDAPSTKAPTSKAVLDAAEETLTAPERKEAANELGERTWNATAKKKFSESFADWYAGAKKFTGKLLAAFKKVAGRVRAAVLAGALIFNPSVSTDATIMSLPVTEPEPDLSERPSEPGFSAPTATGPNVLTQPPSTSVPSVTPPTVPVNLTAPVAKFGNVTASRQTRATANWIVQNGDNKGAAFFIGDKRNGMGYFFDPNGNLVRAFPTLFGKDIGDKFEPGKKITPSGRFEGELGWDMEGELGQTLDFAPTDDDSVVAIHRVWLGDGTAADVEGRRKRLATKTAEDNRISWGCVNVANDVMDSTILPMAEQHGAVVYIMPETQKGPGIAPSLSHVTDPDVRAAALAARSSGEDPDTYLSELPEEAVQLKAENDKKFSLGKSVAEVLRKAVAALSTKSAAHAVAVALVRTRPELATTKTKSDWTLSADGLGGAWDPKTEVMSINPLASAERAAATIVHETGHAVALRTLDMYHTNPAALSPEVRQACADLVALRSRAISAALASAPAGLDQVLITPEDRRVQAFKDWVNRQPVAMRSRMRGRYYGLINDHEFVSEVLTRQEFQNMLATFQTGYQNKKGKTGNIWAAVKKALRTMFFNGRPVAETSILAKAFDSAVDLLATADPNLSYNGAGAEVAVSTIDPESLGMPEGSEPLRKIDNTGLSLMQGGIWVKDGEVVGLGGRAISSPRMSVEEFLNRTKLSPSIMPLLRQMYSHAFDRKFTTVNVSQLVMAMDLEPMTTTISSRPSQEADKNKQELENLRHTVEEELPMWLRRLLPSAQFASPENWVRVQGHIDETAKRLGPMSQKLWLDIQQEGKLDRYIELTYERYKSFNQRMNPVLEYFPDYSISHKPKGGTEIGVVASPHSSTDRLYTDDHHNVEGLLGTATVEEKTLGDLRKVYGRRAKTVLARFEGLPDSAIIGVQTEAQSDWEAEIKDVEEHSVSGEIAKRKQRLESAKARLATYITFKEKTDGALRNPLHRTPETLQGEKPARYYGGWFDAEGNLYETKKEAQAGTEETVKYYESLVPALEQIIRDLEKTLADQAAGKPAKRQRNPDEIPPDGHPLLRYWEHLVAEAVIEHGLKRGWIGVLVTDAKTAAMTEGHDDEKNASWKTTFEEASAFAAANGLAVSPSLIAGNYDPKLVNTLWFLEDIKSADADVALLYDPNSGTLHADWDTPSKVHDALRKTFGAPDIRNSIKSFTGHAQHYGDADFRIGPQVTPGSLQQKFARLTGERNTIRSGGSNVLAIDIHEGGPSKIIHDRDPVTGKMQRKLYATGNYYSFDKVKEGRKIEGTSTGESVIRAEQARERAIRDANKPRPSLDEGQSQPVIVSTAVQRNGQLYRGRKWNSMHNAVGMDNLEHFPELLEGQNVPQSERGFIVREPDGTERFTNDRDEAAKIAKAAGQATVDANLNSEDLIGEGPDAATEPAVEPAVEPNAPPSRLEALRNQVARLRARNAKDEANLEKFRAKVQQADVRRAQQEGELALAQEELRDKLADTELGDSIGGVNAGGVVDAIGDVLEDQGLPRGFGLMALTGDFDSAVRENPAIFETPRLGMAVMDGFSIALAGLEHMGIPGAVEREVKLAELMNRIVGGKESDMSDTLRTVKTMIDMARKEHWAHDADYLKNKLAGLERLRESGRAGLAKMEQELAELEQSSPVPDEPRASLADGPVTKESEALQRIKEALGINIDEDPMAEYDFGGKREDRIEQAKAWVESFDGSDTDMVAMLLEDPVGTGLTPMQRDTVKAAIMMMYHQKARELRDSDPNKAQRLRDQAVELFEDLRAVASNAGQVLQNVNTLNKLAGLDTDPKTKTKTVYVDPTRRIQKDKLNKTKPGKVRQIMNVVTRGRSNAAKAAGSRLLNEFLKLYPEQEQMLFDFFNGAVESSKIEDFREKTAKLEAQVVSDTVGMLMRMTENKPELRSVLEDEVRRQVREQFDALFNEQIAPASPDSFERMEAAQDTLLRWLSATNSADSLFAKTRDALLQRVDDVAPEFKPLVEKLAGAEVDPSQDSGLLRAVKELLPVRIAVTQSLGQRNAKMQGVISRLRARFPQIDDSQVPKLQAALEAAFNAEMLRYSKREIRRLKDSAVTPETLGAHIRKVRESALSNEDKQKEIQRLRDVAAQKGDQLEESDVDKLVRYLNSGALDDEAAYNVLAEKYDLPTWNVETVDWLQGELEKIQDLPEGQPRNFAEQKLLTELASKKWKEGNWKTKMRHFGDIFNSLWVAGALSAPTTQAVNASWTAFNVFQELMFLAYSQRKVALEKGASAEDAAGFFTDAFRAYKYAIGNGNLLGEEKFKTGSAATNEFVAAVKTGATRFSSESKEALATLEQYKFEPPTSYKPMDFLKWVGRSYLASNRWVGRVMLASDAFNRTVARTGYEIMAARAEAILRKQEGDIIEISDVMDEIFDPSKKILDEIEADIKQNGLTGRDAQRRYHELLEQKLYTQQAIADGEAFASKASFNNLPEGAVSAFIMETLGRVVKLPVIGRAIGGFPKTFANLTEQSMNMSPLGFLKAKGLSLTGRHIRKGSLEYHQMMARATIGTAALGMLGAAMLGTAMSSAAIKRLGIIGALALALKGAAGDDDDKERDVDVYGTGPTDYKQARQAREAGLTQSGVSVGPISITYNDIPGVGLWIGLFAAVRDMQRYDARWQQLNRDEQDSLLIPLGQRLIGTVFDRNMLGGLNNAVKALVGKEYEQSNAMMRLLNSTVEGVTKPAFTRWLSATITKKEAGFDLDHTIKGWLMNRFPLLPDIYGKTAFNVLGEDIEDKWWEPTAKRFIQLPEIDSHPVLTPLVKAGLFLPAVTSEVTLPDESKLRKSDPNFYTYVRAYAESVGQQVTPAVVNDYLSFIDKAETPEDRIERKKHVQKILTSTVGSAARQAAQNALYKATGRIK